MNIQVTKVLLQLRRCPTWVWLLLILLLSFSVRLWYWKLAPVISRDGCLYLYFAQQWYNTGIFPKLYLTWDVRTPPAFIYFVVILMKLGLSTEAAGIGINLLLGTFTPLLAYGLAYEITEKKNIAICAALLMAVNPAATRLSVEVQRDMIYLFFAGITLWLTAAGIRTLQWKYWLGTGIACGGALLLRFEALELFLIVSAILLFLQLSKRLSWKKNIFFFVVFIMAFFVTSFSISTMILPIHKVFPIYKKFYRSKVKKAETVFFFKSESDQK